MSGSSFVDFLEISAVILTKTAEVVHCCGKPRLIGNLLR